MALSSRRAAMPMPCWAEHRPPERRWRQRRRRSRQRRRRARCGGEARALQKNYGDRTVSCVQGEGPRCRRVRQQIQQNGQRVLAIEMVSANDGKNASGTLVLSFGLELDAAVTLQVDDKPAEAPRRFSTCLPASRLHRCADLRRRLDGRPARRKPSQDHRHGRQQRTGDHLADLPQGLFSRLRPRGGQGDERRGHPRGVPGKGDNSVPSCACLA
jgi:hypothetical protein